MSLNPQQQSAVETIAGPLLILAGAGSGKTTVLMNRIAYMINSGISPRRILAVTFTNKAASEMRERIARHVSEENAGQLTMSTFHSFCLEVLQRERKHLDIPRFKVADTGNSAAYMRQVIRGKTKFKPSTILGLISALKNEMVTSNDFLTFTSSNPYIDWNKVRTIIRGMENEHIEVLKWAFPAYEKLMKEKEYYDFDDLILETVHLFLKHPQVLEKYQERYPYIMVDEYQDTNRSQYALIKMIAEKYRNLAVVGDDFQSIYAFRGSDIRNILQFDIDYPEAKIVKLEQNYRSTKKIIEAANSVISRNRNQKKKTLFTENDSGELIQVFTSDVPVNEARYIADCIAESVEKGEYAYRDFTVLFRNNALSADIETVFSERGIPYNLLSGRGFYEREEIQDILKYLEFIDNPRSLDAFKRIIRKPKRFIAEKTIDKIESRIDHSDILDVLKNSDEIERMQKKAKIDAQEFVDLIEDLRLKMDSVSAIDIVEEVLERIDYEGKVLSAYDNPTQEEKKANIDKLIEQIANMEAIEGRKLTVGEFVEKVTMYSANLDEGDSDRVKLMTIHGSKGLEFPVVFLIGLNEGTFPSFYIDTPEDMEEERRLCYVAITRAKEKLYLTLSRKKFQKTKKEKVGIFPSLFLYEIKDHLKNKIE